MVPIQHTVPAVRPSLDFGHHT